MDYNIICIYKYKNEAGCRDDMYTMPKTVDTIEGTARRSESRCRDWVAEDCCMLSLLLAVPSCIYSFWHGVIPTSCFDFFHLCRA